MKNGYIESKKELKFYIMADYMMNRGVFKPSLKTGLQQLYNPDYVMRFLRFMRKLSYYTGKNKFMSFVLSIKYRQLSVKLGFSISKNVFGYGLVIPHYGTVVVGSGNSIGNYCVLHTSTCITAGSKKIGDGFYVSSGAKIVKDISLGDNVSVGANSLVNKSFDSSNVLLVGMPADVVKQSEAWYVRDGKEYTKRHYECEKLKNSLGIL